MGLGIWSNGEISGNIIKQMSVNGLSVMSAAAGENVSLALNMADGSRVYLTSSPRIRIEPDPTIVRPPVKLPERKKVRVVLPEVKPRKSAQTRLLVKTYSLSEAIETARAGADIVFLDIFDPEFPDAQTMAARSCARGVSAQDNE